MADRDRATRFAQTELEALADAGHTLDELRRTLTVFFETGGSQHATAQTLGIARNTVTNRIHRAEQLLGRPISKRHQQLQAALAIFHEQSLI